MALLSPAILVALGLLIVRFCYTQWIQSGYLSGYIWLGTEGKTIFPKLRARFRNTFHFKQEIENAYRKYSLQEQTFVLPTISDSLIMLPPSHMEWIVNQPDEVLSSLEPHKNNLQSHLTFSHPHIVENPVHHLVVSRELTRQLSTLTEDIVDELNHSIDLFWPTDPNVFQDVHVFKTIMQVVARTSNRVFVGLPLCRNEEYLVNAAGFAQEVPKWAAILRQFPTITRPLLAKIFLRKNREHIAAFFAVVTPEIERRQAIMAEAAEAEKGTKTLPNDLLQWLTNRGEDLGGIERDPSIIAGRLMALNFAAIHTSTFSITNAIFDLVSSDPSVGYIEQLREEAESVLAEGNGVWTKNGLAKMYKIDSALRESSRLGSFLGPGMIRTVVARDGVTAPNGTFCPPGSSVGIPTAGIHNDPVHYEDAARYDPFRFSKQRSLVTEQRQRDRGAVDHHHDLGAAADDENDNDYVKKANLAFVSTSGTYHPFGHGKHACPGRFFAANELKLLLAYLVLNYDFELLDERPESKWLGTILVPPMNSSIRVRRRDRGRS